jgi:hypothetical protein
VGLRSRTGSIHLPEACQKAIDSVTSCPETTDMSELKGQRRYSYIEWKRDNCSPWASPDREAGNTMEQPQAEIRRNVTNWVAFLPHLP